MIELHNYEISSIAGGQNNAKDQQNSENLAAAFTMGTIALGVYLGLSKHPEVCASFMNPGEVDDCIGNISSFAKIGFKFGGFILSELRHM